MVIGNVKLCEICGANPAVGKFAVEGVFLSVCAKCGRFGSQVRDVYIRRPSSAPRLMGAEEGGREIVPDFGRIVRTAREKAGLTQKELAAKATERESVITKIEQGVLIPSASAATKLEKVLGVRLFSSVGPDDPKGKKSSARRPGPSSGDMGMTLGDVIKIR